MLIALFSAKGSPGVTSSALALAAVWPRPVVLIEADLSGSDLAYRVRVEMGGSLSITPNILGLVSAMRGERSIQAADWTQRLKCGVDLVPGVTTPSQSRAMDLLWPDVAAAASSSECDVIVDLGRIRRESPNVPLAAAADVHVPVLAGTVDSLMHTRELLKDFTAGDATTSPLLVGRIRSAESDCEDVDEVLTGAGVIAGPCSHLPLDHPGLSALQAGANLSARGRASQLVRGARAAARALSEMVETGVAR